MKIVIGVDWSDEAFATVEQVWHVYRPTEVTLVHAVDLGIFEYPVLAQAANVQGYDEFRRSLTNAGQQVLDRIAHMLPLDPSSIGRINEVGNPAKVILDAAQAAEADLVAVGARGRNRVAEVVLGSVSHRVLLHASRPTLIVKGSAKPIQRVLVAVEGKDDADRIVRWLLLHPFANPVEVCVLSVVVPLGLADPYHVAGLEAWSEAARRHAEELVNGVGAALQTPRFQVTAKVATGEVADTVAEQAKEMDLVVTASHGRQRLDRFLLGSVSHSIVHRVACAVLVVR